VTGFFRAVPKGFAEDGFTLDSGFADVA